VKILISHQNLAVVGTPRGVQRVATQLAYALQERDDVDLHIALDFQAADGLLHCLALPYAAFYSEQSSGAIGSAIHWIAHMVVALADNFPFIVNLGRMLDKKGSLKKLYRKYRIISGRMIGDWKLLEQRYPSAVWHDVDHYDILFSLEFMENLWNQSWCLARNIKKICFIHDLIFARMNQSKDNKIYNNLHILESVISRSDALICNSKSTEDDLQTVFSKFNINTSVALLSHMRADANHLKFKSMQKKCTTIIAKAGYFTIFMLGDMDRRKNLTTAMEALPLLAMLLGGRKVSLAVVGNTKNLESVKTVLAGVRQTAEVMFYGYVSDDDLPQFYLNADVFLYPSLWEGFGMPILEAYAYGLPVVVSGVAGMPEVAGDLGTYVDPCDPEDIARGLFAVAAMSPAEREAFSTKAKARAAEFSWERTAASVCEAMMRLVKDKSMREIC
jgi:glycosyltransferase involved in cell wall biosynthesis